MFSRNMARENKSQPDGRSAGRHCSIQTRRSLDKSSFGFSNDTPGSLEYSFDVDSSSYTTNGQFAHTRRCCSLGIAVGTRTRDRTLVTMVSVYCYSAPLSILRIPSLRAAANLGHAGSVGSRVRSRNERLDDRIGQGSSICYQNRRVVESRLRCLSENTAWYHVRTEFGMGLVPSCLACHSGSRKAWFAPTGTSHGYDKS
mmetsp:Transcript_16335/g.30683  ORF Transcript_16335/g.30683 Transcript_16335/m.30683 type:complete len:200 (-) Transcript_16335:561-1160(-)